MLTGYQWHEQELERVQEGGLWQEQEGGQEERPAAGS